VSDIPDEQQQPLPDRNGSSSAPAPAEITQKASYDHIYELFDHEVTAVQINNLKAELLLARIYREVLHLSQVFPRTSGTWNDTGQNQLIESLLLVNLLSTFYSAKFGDDTD